MGDRSGSGQAAHRTWTSVKRRWSTVLGLALLAGVGGALLGFPLLPGGMLGALGAVAWIVASRFPVHLRHVQGDR